MSQTMAVPTRRDPAAASGQAGRAGGTTRGGSRTSSRRVTWLLPGVVDRPGADRDRPLVQRRPVERRCGRASRSGGGWHPDPAGRSLFVRPDAPHRADPEPALSFLTMVLAVPLGAAFAIGIDRWRGRPPAAGELHDAVLVRGARDHHRRRDVPGVHLPAEVRPARDAGAGAGPRHVTRRRIR